MKLAEVSAPFRYSRRTRVLLAYVSAVVLPPLCSLIVVHSRVLYPFPIALQFLPIITLAFLAGIGPALVAGAATFVARVVQGTFFPSPPLTPRADLFRFIIMAAMIVIIELLSRRRRLSEQRLEDALDNLRDRTDALVESLHNSKCASWILDLNSGRSARFYEGSYEVFGRPFSEIEALPSLRSLIHPEDQLRLSDLVQHLRTSWEPIVFEHRTPWPNGEVRWLEMRGTRVQGRPCVWRGVTLDVTERRVAEAAILRAEKLAAMGRLASTVAHEINNPLEAVTNLLYLALTDKDLPESTRSYLAAAEAELARLGNVTRLTLGYLHSGGSASQVEIAQVVDDVLSIFHHRAEIKSARIERQYAPGAIAAIPQHELRQIVINLIANAADALTSAEAPALFLQVAAAESTVTLTVADNGEGIDGSDLQRIFEPFFSTKDEVGTGIGLWVTRELVEKSGGHIHVSSGDLPNGMSTAFRVDLPSA